MRRTALAALLLLCLSTAAFALTPEEETLLARIDAIHETRNLDEAVALIDSLLPAARAAEDRRFLLELLGRKGPFFATYGHAAASEPVLREARALAEEQGDDWLLCNQIRWLSVSLGTLGRMDEARPLYDELWELADRIDADAYRGWALVGKAWWEFLQGRNVESVELYRGAIECFRAGGERRGEIWALNGLGVPLNRIGDYEGSLVALKAAVAAARETGDPFIESMALNNLGAHAYNLGDPGLALRQFERARDLQLSSNYSRGALLPAYNVALCHIQLGRLDEATRELEVQLAQVRTHGWASNEVVVLKQLAEISLQRERPRDAIARVRELLALSGDAPLKPRIEARDVLVRALAIVGDDEGALAVAEAGLRELENTSAQRLHARMNLVAGSQLIALERWEEALVHLERSLEIAEEMDLFGIRVSALTRAAGAHRALARPDSALALLRRAAAIWEAKRITPLELEWRETYGKNGHGAYLALARMLLAPRDGMDEASRTREAFDLLQGFKAKTLLERMTGPGKLPAREEAVGLRRLQEEVLADGELLLDLYQGRDITLLFAVTRGECRAVVLPDGEKLSEPLRKLYDLLARRPGDSGGGAGAEIAASASAALRERIFGEVEGMIAGSERVILCPDGMLNLLPDGLLAAGRSGGGEWHRAPSATVLAHLRRADSGDEDGALRGLAVAGVDPTDGAVLPGARREVLSLARRYRDIEARTLGQGDTLPTDLGSLTGRRLLHLATHASVDDQNPWQSSLQLGNAEESISASEIARDRLDARLAVLAACSSAGGRVLSGEGVLGLSSAFLSAGVPAVLATLWPVDDEASARLSEEFYRALAAGECAGAALERARLALRERPETAHPFYWAGFVLVGDGGLVLPLETRSFPERHAASLLALLAGSALLLLALRRNATT